jgi:hypothetical protein
VSVTVADVDFRHGLSAVVLRAVPAAIRIIEQLIERLTSIESGPDAGAIAS